MGYSKRIDMRMHTGERDKTGRRTARGVCFLNDNDKFDYIEYSGEKYTTFDSLNKNAFSGRLNMILTKDERLVKALKEAGFKVKSPDARAVSLHVTVPASIYNLVIDEAENRNLTASRVVAEVLSNHYNIEV